MPRALRARADGEPGRLRGQEGQKRHDVGHATGGTQRPARLAQPRRGRIPGATPGNPACRKTKPGPRFDCVSSRGPQQQGTRAPRAGPRASPRPPHSAATTSAPRQSRSSGVTKYGDAGQLSCGVQSAAAPSPAPTSTPKPSSRASPRPNGGEHMVAAATQPCGSHGGSLAPPPAASSSGASTSPDKG